MIQESDVRDKLAAVASHDLSLEDFVDWLESASWNMHADSSPEAIDLVSSIHLWLSEYDHRDVGEPELRRRLLSLVDPEAEYVVISIDLTASVMRARSASNAATFPEFSREAREFSREVRVPT